MKSNLRIETIGKKENAEVDDEPVSPTGQYFNSKALSLCILAILESQVPIDDSCAMLQLQEVFLPINSRFSSIMISDNKGVKQWKKVEVNLQDHLKVPKIPENLSIDSYDKHFDEYMTKITMHPLPQNRPLWEVHILKYPTSKAAGHLIFKLHHALGDGYSLMGALLSCVQRVENPSIPLTFPSVRSSLEVKGKNTIMGVIRRVPRTLTAILNGVCDFGWTFLKSTCIADDKTPIRSGNEGMSLYPSKLSTLTLSLDQIKIIKAKLDTTVNDILAGIIFMGIRLYMQEIDTETSKSQSTALVLLNTRNIRGYMSIEEMTKTHTKLWGNQFAFLHVAMPKLINDNFSNPLDFIYETQKQITRLRNSPAISLTAQCLEIARKCKGSEAVAELIYSTINKSSFGITNLIGPTEQVALANHPVKGIYFMVCGIPSSLAVTIMSYMRTITIGITVEKDYIDSQKLTSCVNKAFELIYEAAIKMSRYYAFGGATVTFGLELIYLAKFALSKFIVSGK
ncbi:O-acyltransferase WSD1, partial [Bienertia sinuspersici]